MFPGATPTLPEPAADRAQEALASRFVGPRLTPEQEQTRQIELAQQGTQALPAPLFGNPEDLVPLGKVAGFGLGVGRLMGRQATGQAAELVGRAVRQLPGGNRLFDFVIQHAGRPVGTVAVDLPPAMNQLGVRFFRLDPAVRETPLGLQIARDVFEELRRRLPGLSGVQATRVTGSRIGRGTERLNVEIP